MTQPINTAWIEVLGNAILSALEAMKIAPERAMRIFAERGIVRPDRSTWYPVEKILSAYREIGKQIGPNTVRAIGRNIPRNAEFPPGLKSVDQALKLLDIAYQMNHRGPGHIGGYHYESTGARSARMVCDNPYPCPMDEGLMEALAERFKPPDAFFIRLQHEPATCRERGDPSCAYKVTW